MPTDASPDLIVRRVMPVDLRATAELIVRSFEQRGIATDGESVRNAAQAALEDAQRVLVIGAYHENQPGFAHGKMVGVLAMNLIVSVQHAGEMGFIETLFVRPDYRRRGLGRRMLAEVLAFCSGRGVRAIEIALGDGDDPAAAHALYGELGFRPVESRRLQRRA